MFRKTIHLRCFAVAAAVASMAGLGLAATAQAAQVQMVTTLGTMRIEVDEVNAPVTAENFLQYVRDGFYNGLIFHRVIPNFVVQGGGFTEKFERAATRPPIVNEDGNGLKNAQYTLSMARTNDPDSASSQFFINLRDNSNLDPVAGRRGYAVFAKVIEGQEVVDAIAAKPTGTFRGLRDVPVEAIVITEATIVADETTTGE